MDIEEAYRDAENYIMAGIDDISTSKRALYYAQKAGYNGKPSVDDTMLTGQKDILYRGLIENSNSATFAERYIDDLISNELRYNLGSSVHGGKALYYSSSFGNAAKY